MTFPKVAHRIVNIDGLDIFYREAGPKEAPTILLLHGFPTWPGSKPGNTCG
jgi:pimeloyl-ACP methyl ester carboxylesterase